MSSYSVKIEKLIKKCFPSFRVKKEKFVLYQNTRLFFDFFIPELGVLIEVNGEQHYSFNKFYHNDKDTFLKQKFYDKLKSEWVVMNGYKLISINYKEVDEFNVKTFKEKIVSYI